MASASGFVQKPFQIENLVDAIEVASERFADRGPEVSELTCATILGSVADAIIGVDSEKRVRFMNEAAEALTGWSAANAQYRSLGAVLKLDAGGGALDLIMQAVNSRSPITVGSDAIVVGRGGIRIPVDGSFACVVDSSGRAVGTSIMLRDATGLRQGQADSKLYAAQLRAVVDTAVDGVLMLDAAGTIVMINRACGRLFRYTNAEMIGHDVKTVITSPLSNVGASEVDPRKRGQVVASGASLCCRGDGSTFPADISVGQISNVTHFRYVCIVHDASERRQLEAAFLGAVGQEQQRFGADLHDGLGQELTGLSFLLSALVNAARDSNSPHVADLERAHDVAWHALHSCQAIAQGLSPIGSIGGDLVRALRDLVGRLRGVSAPTVDISVLEVSRLDLSALATDHLYRIAQEALTNALKHAHAKSINVSLDVDSENVRLEVRDDGGGLRPDTRTSGLGLRTMQYRASMIGARFEIMTSKLGGTRVVCDCPQRCDAQATEPHRAAM